MHTILGINGAVGAHLADILIQKNIPVRGVSRRPFPGPWEHVSADILDAEAVNRAVEGSEVVYLLVGLPYLIKVWERDWPVAMKNTIDACLAHEAKLVFLDNVYALGLVDGPMLEETPHHPISRKGIVRARIADMMLDAMENQGLVGAIGRSADFYGPYTDKSVLNSTVFDRFDAGKSAFVMGRADKVHTYSFTLDLAPALAILGTDERANGQIWNLPTDQTPWTGKDWVEAGAKAFGVKPKFQETPTFMLRILGLFSPLFRELIEMNYQYTHPYVLNSDKFERVFGLKPTPVQDGLDQTVAWYRSKKLGA